MHWPSLAIENIDVSTCQSFTWYITLIDLWILKNPCILGVNPIWSGCMILLKYCWIWFANILLRISASMFLSDISLLLSRFSHVRLCATHRREPIRLPHPWDSPGKNTGVGCHFLLQCMKVKSESEATQSCPTPSDPMDCSLPGPSIHGIVIIFLCVCMLSHSVLYDSFEIPWTIVCQAPLSTGFLRQENARTGSSWPRDWKHVFCDSCIAGGFLTW